jgi:hypothetical protein
LVLQPRRAALTLPHRSSPTVPTCEPAHFPSLLTPIPSYICANTISAFAIVAAVLLGLYVISCVVLGALTINVSTVFSEKEVLFASMNIVIVGGIVAFLFFFTTLSQGAKTALVAVGLAWCSTFSVAVLVVPKLWLIHFKGEDYTNALAFNKASTNTTEQINTLKTDLQRATQDVTKLTAEVAELRQKLGVPPPVNPAQQAPGFAPSSKATSAGDVQAGEQHASNKSASALELRDGGNEAADKPRSELALV